MIYSRDLTITPENAHLYDDLVRVEGYLWIKDGATLTATKLVCVSEIWLDADTTLIASSLTVVRNIIVNPGSKLVIPKLIAVDSLLVSPSAHIKAPSLINVGVNSYRRSYESNLSSRRRSALALIYDHAYVVDDHRGSWLLDQIVRALTGCEVIGAHSAEVGSHEYVIIADSDEYKDWVQRYEGGRLGDEMNWKIGIAP